MTAFVSGGFVPAQLRGSSNRATITIADWYPTLCNIAGVSPSDDVMLNGAKRPIDGRDIWPLLLGNSSESPHEYLPTSEVSYVHI
eukprot:COSAG01_NODE_233_length_20982_cov_14.774458_7_plen_85_part_00